MTHLEPLKNLFNKYVYKTPLNQRGFSWTTKQLRELFKDFELLKNDFPKHYCGPIIINSHDKFKTIDGSNCEICLIDDGQQRLTTFYLIIHSISLRLEEIHKQSGDPAIKKEINATKKILFEEEIGGNKIRRIINENDDLNTYFIELLNNNKPTVDSSPKRNLRSLFDYLNHKYEHKSFDEIKYELNKFLDNAIFVRVDLAKQKIDRYLSFEAINSRGLDLTQFDKIKNYCMLIKDRQKLNINPEKEWYKSIQKLDFHERSTRNNEDEFICDLLSQFLYKHIKVEDCHSEFVNYFNSLIHSADKLLISELEKFISLWEDFAHAYGIITSKRNRSIDKKLTLESNSWLTKIDNLDLQATTRKLLISSYLSFSKSDFEEATQLCEKFSFREFAVGRRKKDKRKIELIKISAWILFKKKKINFLKDGFCILLNKDSKIEDNITNFAGFYYPHANLKGWSHTLYFLYEYESHLSPNAPTQSFPESQKFSTKSIEHILPQKWEDIKKWAKNWDKITDTNTIKHKLGNLVLINSKHNSQLGNKAFDEKLNGKPGNHFYNNLKSYYGEKEIKDFAVNGEWTVDSVNNREKKLIEFFLERWKIQCNKKKIDVLNIIKENPRKKSKPRNNIVEIILNLKTHKSASSTNLHKPLTLLFLIYKYRSLCLADDSTKIKFNYSSTKSELDEFLSHYLEKPNSKYPFSFLEKEIWHVEYQVKLKNKSNPSKNEMEGCIGYFTEEFEEILKEENKINEIIDLIIETYIKEPAEVIKSILSQV